MDEVESAGPLEADGSRELSLSIKRSITFKILAIVSIATVAAVVSVLLLANVGMKMQLDRSEAMLYGERLDKLYRILSRHQRRVSEASKRASTLQEMQQAAIRELEQIHEHTQNPLDWPVILDQRGNILLECAQVRSHEWLGERKLRQHMLKNGSGFVLAHTLSAGRQWCAFRTFEPWDWLVVYAVSHDVRYAELAGFRDNLLITSIGILLLAIVLVSGVLTRMTGPIRRLTTVSAAMAQGDLDHHIDTKGNDEIAVLARSFDDMRNSIREKISDLAEANRSLVDEMELSQAIIKSLPGLFYMIDPQGKILRWNENFEKTTGYTPDEVSNMTPLAFVAPADVPSIQEALDRAFREGSSVQEASLMTRTGKMIPHYFTGVVANLGGGLCLVGVGIDIEDRKRMEESLRASQDRLQSILDNTTSLVCVKSDDGRYVAVNRRFEELVGQSQEDVVGKTDYQLLPQEVAEEVTASDRQVFDSGTSIRVEERLPHGDGMHVYLSVKFLLSEVSSSSKVLCSIATDITDRIKAEHDLRLYAAKMKLKTAEIQAAKNAVDEVVADLRRSNQELDEFAYIASHDLKEPLRGIHNYATFVLEDYASQLDDEGREKLLTLTRLTQRLEAFIESLLQYSRLGRSELAHEETDLNRVIEGVIDSIQISLKEKKVDVRIPRPLPTVICDRVRVAEVFHNLITNAIKYNESPEPFVEIGYLDRESGEGEEGSVAPQIRSLTFYVKDNGIGIPEKHAQSVFRIFKRLHGRDKYGGGTGAGLTIAKKIVHRHHGRIWVESAQGEGSTFFFTLQEMTPHDDDDA